MIEVGQVWSNGKDQCLIVAKHELGFACSINGSEIYIATEKGLLEDNAEHGWVLWMKTNTIPEVIAGQCTECFAHLPEHVVNCSRRKTDSPLWMGGYHRDELTGKLVK